MLQLVCGKAGAGKSTRCAELAQAPRTILIAQDPWMAALFGDELKEIGDYLRLVPRLRAAMGPHLVTLLRAGLSVVLDWPANTRATRRWLRDIAAEAGVEARLHWLDLPDATCLARVQQRNAGGAHEFTLTPDQFAEITRYFEPPAADEGLTLVRTTG